MAPVQPKKRVKSIKETGDNQKPKKKILTENQRCSKYFDEFVQEVLKKYPGVTKNTKRVIKKLFRKMMRLFGKEALNLMARRSRRTVTIKEAQMVVANMIPGELGLRAHNSAMKAIAQYRRQQVSVLPRPTIA